MHNEFKHGQKVVIELTDGIYARGYFDEYSYAGTRRLIGVQLENGLIRRFFEDMVTIKSDENIEPVIVHGMSSERFKELLEELDGNSVKTLAEKNARYSQNGDALHNFRSGAEISGGTPAQACWGYMTKHLVALRDKVEENDFSNREDLLEKCQDTINYIRFLWCIANDTEHMTTETFFDSDNDKEKEM